MLLLLAAVPASFALVGVLLAISWLLERSVLSPRSMIMSAARSTMSHPDFAEQFVAQEVERLLNPQRR